MSARIVAVFREDMLNPSETFIFNQMAAYARYSATPVCLRRVQPSLPCAPHMPRFGRHRAALAARFNFEPGISSILRNAHARVLHTHFISDAALISSTIMRTPLPVVVTAHGWDATVADSVLRLSGARERALAARRARVYAHADMVICVSNYIRSLVIGQGCPPGKARTIYTGIPVLARARADFREEYTRQRHTHGPVLFVGRLVKNKGVDTLIRAMAELQNELPGKELVVIGDGPERVSLEKLARERRAKVIFRGPETREAVASSMAQASVVVGPSCVLPSGASEGFGMVFLEAANAGTPVIGTRVGGIPEAIHDGKTGILVPPNQPSLLADAIRATLNSYETAIELAHNGSRRLRSEFDVERQTEKLESVYDELLGIAS